MILAVIAGVGVALVINYFFGDLFFWIAVCSVISLGTEVALRTGKTPKNNNVSQPKNDDILLKQDKYPPEKPPKPNF